MAFFTQNKFNYTTGVPDGNDVYPSVSSTWGDDGAGVLGNGTIAFPTAAGGAGQVLTDVGGTGVLTFADAPSTPPSGILGSVQLSDGAGGFTSDQPSFNYNSTTKRLGVGKVATTSLDVLEDSIGVNAFFENVSGSDFDTAVGLKLKHRTTIDMEATFGIAQEFYLEDDTSGELLAGSVGFERVDSDSERRYVVKGGTNGTQELFSIDSNREFTVEKGLRNGFGVDSLSGVSDDALAWNINDANAAAIIANAGSGIGLRVIANSGNILSLEDTNEVAQVLVSNTGLVTFNAAANATGDFEVLAETSGTAAFIDVSKGDLGLGTNVTNPGTFNGRWITMSDADRNGVEMRRTGSDSDGTTIGQFFGTAPFVSDQLGIVGSFAIRTDGSTLGNRGGQVTLSAKENGADVNHKLILRNTGMVEVERGMTLNTDGNSTADFEIKGTSGSTVAFVDVSKKGLGINTNIVNPSTFNGKWITMLDADRSGIEMKRNGSDTDLSTIGQFFGTSTQISGGSGIAGSFFIGTDGATAGNRGGRVGFSAKENGSNTFHSLIVRSTGIVEVDRGMTLNKDANGAADFEVLAETTGTAFKVDVSTGNSAFGTTSPNVFGSSGTVVTLEHPTNHGTLEFSYKGSDTGTVLIGDIFGVSNNISGINGLATQITFRQDGITVGNRGGKVSLLAKQDGLSLFHSLDFGSDGILRAPRGAVFNGDFSTGDDGDVTINKTTSGVLAYFDTSSDDIGFGTGSPNVFGNAGTVITIEHPTLHNTIEYSYKGVDSPTQLIGQIIAISGDITGDSGLAGSIAIRHSGTTDGNRGGSIEFTTKGDAALPVNTMSFDHTGHLEIPGAVTANTSASATGDFEVLAEATGTAFYVDVDEGTVGINKEPGSGVTLDLTGTGSSRMERTTSQTTGVNSVFGLVHKTSGDMVDGFGPGLRYLIKDNSGGTGQIGILGFVRDGADNEGKFVVSVGTDGEEEAFHIEASGLGVFNPDGNSTGDFRFKGQSATALYVKAGSSEAVIIGSETPKSNGDLTLDRFGRLAMKETTTPTGTAGYGCVYTKSDNKLYFQDGAGAEHEIAFV